MADQDYNHDSNTTGQGDHSSDQIVKYGQGFGAPENPFEQHQPDLSGGREHFGSWKHQMDSYEWSPQIAAAYSNTRAYQDKVSHLVATVPVSTAHARDQDQRSRVDGAVSSKANIDLGLEADPNKAIDQPHYREALHRLEMRRLQTPKREKSSLRSELSRLRPPKEETKTGLEIGTELIKGLLAGAAKNRKQRMERKADRDNKAADDLALNHAINQDIDNAKSRRNDAAGKPPENAIAANDDQGGKVVEAGKSDPKTAAPVATIGGTKRAESPDPAESTGTLGMGAAVATINPIVGVGLASAQTQANHKDAGTDHSTDRKGISSLAKGPAEATSKPAVTVTFGKNTNQIPERRLAPIEPANSNNRPAPSKPVRMGALYAQAAQLPKPSGIVTAKGPSTSTPKSQALGLGMAIGVFMKQARTLEGANDRNEPTVVEQAWQMQQRQGRSREK